MGEAGETQDRERSADARPAAAAIPEQQAIEIRKLVHDLSNALEIVVQTSYLLGMAQLQEPASEWLKMLDGGVSKALDLNGQLRAYVREHSPK